MDPLFLAAAGAMAVAAMAFVLLALRRRSAAPASRAALNSALLAQRLSELERERDCGQIGAEEFEAAREELQRRALLEVVASGHPRFFLGTDSAPHARTAKESACGCAGIYTAHAALEFYAEALESVGALRRLADFAGTFAADWYGLPRATERLSLERVGWEVPAVYPFADEDGRPDELVALRAGATCHWRLVGGATP